MQTLIRPAHLRPKHKKRGAPAGNKSYWEYRPKGIMFLPACTLGFSSLITPDVYEGKSTFKLNAHFTQTQAEALADKLQAEIVDPGYKAIKDEALAAIKAKYPAALLTKVSAADWLEGAMKEPKEKSRIQLPFLNIKCNSHVKNRQDELIPQTVKAWDAKGKLLDLPSLHLGMGSIVSVGVSAAYWHGTLNVETEGPKKKPVKWFATPTLRLVGVRVLKLEQFGGDSSVGEVSPDDMVGVEEGFEAEDLAAFARSDSKPVLAAAPEELNMGVTSDEPEEF